ncbi:right-handed parallel beta-helix repeat-containing protein [Cryobacterium shii]|uniref:Right-handed parallel beta-helix repeat-containing protein n=1 Tax=Cryobacterium shii TaxID=1259235 RepID=A0AAQ2C7E1_9MICO|nr:right-handed parallel beta-helix repeat-containing protein [Cryobacterium shii]TFC50494.1 right-handed parallel beta-helix repeat-containing protein [Cryobacterium shii]
MRALALGLALITAAAIAIAVPTEQPASAAVSTLNDSAPAFSYSSGWTYTTNPPSGYANGDAHYATSAGATATVAFTGVSVTLIGGTNSLHGRADVKVCDGSGSNCGATTIVDSYSPTTLTQQVLYTASGLPGGSHTLVVTVRSDSTGQGTYTDIDLISVDDGLTSITGTRYVDNRVGSSCSNSGAGTSTSTPWCDFTPVNDRTLAPGAQVLLARGASFAGPLRLTGSGTSSSWITLGAYGAGALPIIHGSGLATDRTVIVTNPDYWHIQDLELTNAGMGLLIPFTSLGHTGLDVHGLWAHDLFGIFNGRGEVADYPDTQNSSAITITAAGVPTTSLGQNVLSNISIRDNRTQNTSGVYLMADPGFTGTPSYAPSTFSNIDVTNNRFEEAKAPMIAIEASSNVKFVGNWLDCKGHVYEPQGTTCFFLTAVDDVVIQNNVVANMPDNSTHDQTGIDLEYAVNNVRIRGNLFANNAGAGVEMLQLANRSNDFSTGTVIEQNAFYNNGASGQKGHIAIDSYVSTPPQATIRDNVYQVSPNGFISNVNGNPPLTNVTQSNNLSVSSIYPAASQFSSTQGQNGWASQTYSDSGVWTNMATYTAVPSKWSAGGGSSIDAFTLTPGVGSSQWVARTWTAPSAGTVRITGRVAMNAVTAAGSSVLIERNGTPVWPTAGGSYYNLSAGDRNGVDADVTLAVAAGDTIRFVVYAGNATGAATSWTPSISYQ